MTTKRCTGRMRHWFSVYGCPGTRKPLCACGARNPRPLTGAEWDELADVAPCEAIAVDLAPARPSVALAAARAPLADARAPALVVDRDHDVTQRATWSASSWNILIADRKSVV